MSNFDRVAPIYDRLVRLVFGRAMHRAQTTFSGEIASNARVLILGGGTGWLLVELLSAKPACTVVYIDSSAKMIEMAKRKVGGFAQRVDFIYGTEKDIPSGIVFDAVITHFYLDLFEHDRCAEVTQSLRRFCRRGSIWLASDFIQMTWWHSIMLTSMYAFFSIWSNLKTKVLPDWKKSIQGAGFTEIRSAFFFNGFICSVLYRLDD